MGMVISAVISAVMQPGGAGMDVVASGEWTQELSLTGLVINAVINAVMQPDGAGMGVVVSWEWTRELSLTGLVINAVINAVMQPDGGRDGHGGKLGMDAETRPNGAGN